MKETTLTVAEIADLARFAGLVLDETRLPDSDENETEIAIGPCPAGGLYDHKGDPGRLYSKIAWYAEYPEEGSFGLGPEIQSNTKIADA